MTKRDGIADAPTVSVLLATYNPEESHLREAMESILNQTFTDFEFLVVDDGSTDPNVERVIRSYDDPRIRVAVNGANIGISEARNRLLRMARGKYLAVMDQDDISLPPRLEEEAAYLDAHPEVGVVSCHAEHIGDKSSFFRPVSEDMEIKAGLMNGNLVLHPAAMMRKSVLTENNIQYEEKFTPAEDYALCCRLIRHTQFYNLPKILFRYRYHSGNTSGVQKAKIARAAMAVQDFARTDYPTLYDIYLHTITTVTRVKIFGFIPGLTFVAQGNRKKCLLFGIPLYRAKIKLIDAARLAVQE